MTLVSQLSAIIIDISHLVLLEMFFSEYFDYQNQFAFFHLPPFIVFFSSSFEARKLSPLFLHQNTHILI